jgi:thymidine kinase
MEGELTLIMGPMFSGKTSAVMESITRHRYAGINALVIKYKGDNRYGEGSHIQTHAGSRHGEHAGTEKLSPLHIRAVERLSQVVLPECEKLVIGIDEGQFYPDLREGVAAWLAAGHTIFIAALDGDYQQQMFQPVVSVLPLATHITKLHAVCMKCRSADGSPVPAPFTRRTCAGGAQKLIGGEDVYQAVCARCRGRPSSHYHGELSYIDKLNQVFIELRGLMETPRSDSRDIQRLLNSALPRSSAELTIAAFARWWLRRVPSGKAYTWLISSQTMFLSICTSADNLKRALGGNLFTIEYKKARYSVRPTKRMTSALTRGDKKMLAAIASNEIAAIPEDMVYAPFDHQDMTDQRATIIASIEKVWIEDADFRQTVQTSSQYSEWLTKNHPSKRAPELLWEFTSEDPNMRAKLLARFTEEGDAAAAEATAAGATAGAAAAAAEATAVAAGAVAAGATSGATSEATAAAAEATAAGATAAAEVASEKRQLWSEIVDDEQLM